MKIIGHRGAAGLAPENTLAAIEAGIAAGVDMIEVDVRTTKDGVSVLHHDPAFQKLQISVTTLENLQKTKPDIATLSEAIQAVNRRVPMVIEVKQGSNTNLVASELRKFLRQGWRDKDFFISSFDFALLRQLSELLPELSPIILEKWSGVRASHRARKLGTRYICMKQHFLWWGFIKSMAKSGYKLSAYTLNDSKKAQHWASFGLYGIVTDYPNRFTKKK